MVQRVEIIMLKGRNKKEAQRLCHLAKNLYNAANYEMRQSFISGNRKSGYQISTEFAKDNQSDYRALPAQCSQQIINLLEKNWKSFFKSIKDWKKNPKKYKGRPKLPKYKDKDGYNVLIITSQQIGNKLTQKEYIKLPNGKTINTNMLWIDENIAVVGNDEDLFLMNEYGVNTFIVDDIDYEKIKEIVK